MVDNPEKPWMDLIDLELFKKPDLFTKLDHITHLPETCLEQINQFASGFQSKKDQIHACPAQFTNGRYFDLDGKPTYCLIDTTTDQPGKYYTIATIMCLTHKALNHGDILFCKCSLPGVPGNQSTCPTSGAGAVCCKHVYRFLKYLLDNLPDDEECMSLSDILNKLGQKELSPCNMEFDRDAILEDFKRAGLRTAFDD